MSSVALDDLVAPFDELQDIIAHPDKGDDALTDGQKEAYREAQQSVVDARRKAEAREGHLQVN